MATKWYNNAQGALLKENNTDTCIVQLFVFSMQFPSFHSVMGDLMTLVLFTLNLPISGGTNDSAAGGAGSQP